MTNDEASELLAACKRQRDVWRIGGMPPSPEAVARVERDEAVALAAIVEDYDREHAARVAAEAEADGLRCDLAAAGKARDEAERTLAHAIEIREWTEAKAWEALGIAHPADATALDLAARIRFAVEDRDLYRAALADAARGEAARCDTHYGGTLATQVHADGDGACDECVAGYEHREWTDTPHAAAIRGALKATGGER